MVAKNKRGRVPRVVPPIHDTFGNVIKVLVRPVRTSTRQESNDH